MSTWLAGAAPTGAGLTIPRGPRAKGADLSIGVDHVEVRVGEVAVPLEWDHFVSGRRGFGTGEAWTLWIWGTSNSSSGGLGIGVDGGPSLDAVRRVASGRLSQLAAKGYFFGLGKTTEYPVVPLWAPQYCHAWQDGQQAIVKALLSVLRDRPELRSKITDTSVVSVLLGDMQRELGPAQWPGALTGSNEGRALKSAGFAFPYGRPLPSDKLEPADDAIAKVLAGGRSGVMGSLDAAKVAKLVQKEYAAIDPWPFQALGV